MLMGSGFESAVLRGLLLGVVTLTFIVVFVRFVGLRSFSKMTTFDFVMTVATGSLLATAATTESLSAYVQALAAIAGLFVIQVLIAKGRVLSPAFERLVQNEPLLLMKDGEILHEALRASRVAEADLRAKLREANVLDLACVRAVILETTGDVSVLHGEQLASTLLEGVRQKFS